MPETDRIRRAYQRYRAAGHPGWDSQNLGNQAMLSERELAMSALLARAGVVPLKSARVLDIGCGTGLQLAFLHRLGGHADDLFGIDLLEDRIEQARNLHPEFNFLCHNAETLPYPDSFFDLVLAGLLFSSILSDVMASHVACEIQRVLAPSGVVLWYDLRADNPMNKQVRGMPRRRIQQFFPASQIEMRRITLLPPLSRRLRRLTPVLYPILAKIPVLQTHYIGLLRFTADAQ